MTKKGYFPRHRYPIAMIIIAILSHMFMASRDVSVFLYLLLRVRVSHKTICEWTKKFIDNIPLRPLKYPLEQILICHADEKFITIKGERAYWWSIIDHLGDLIHCIVTEARDLASAKKLFREAREKIGRTVDILVRDGLPSYDKAVKFLGRKCRSVVAGIKGRGIIHNKKFYWITNNPSESLNSEIDSYLAKFQYDFESLESANMFAKLFMLRRSLRRCFAAGELLETPSLLNQSIT